MTDRLRQLFHEGIPIKHIALELGLSRHATKKRLEELGLRREMRRGPPPVSVSDGVRYRNGCSEKADAEFARLMNGYRFNRPPPRV